MKRTKMLAILVVAVGLMVCLAKVSNAVPMGTAFTYQGWLMDANQPADGLYDFQFKLYDNPHICKSVYSYVRSGSGNPNASVRQYLWTESPMSTDCDYVTVWIGGEGYTTSSRYAWNITLILTDGTNTYSEKLRCDCWGNNEGCTPNHYDYYDATETACDGTWKRYTRQIPGNIDKSNLTIKILHLQDSWDRTSASSWYHLYEVYLSDSQGNMCQPIENGHFGKDPNGTSFNDISNWNYSSEDIFGGSYDEKLEIVDGSGGTQLGNTVNKENINVGDGFFTAQLDFGPDPNVFNGDARWLETAVRPGDSNDPNAFVTLSPRQQVTPTPYAIYAKTAGGDNDWTGAGTGSMYATYPADNVGIGTTAPTAKLHIGGRSGVDGIRFPDGTIQTTAGPLTLPWTDSTSNAGNAFSITNTGTGNAIYGKASGGAHGVCGEATGSGGYGVYGKALVPYGHGVYGEATDFSGAIVFGGCFVANGVLSEGVYGEAKGDYGVGVHGMASKAGDFHNYGGYFLALGDWGKGVYGNAAGPNGVGVWAVAGKSGDYANYGGHFRAYGDRGYGIYAWASAISGTNYGVYGRTDSSSGYAGYFIGGRNYFSGNVGIGTTNPQGKLDVNGSIYQRGTELHADYVFEPGYELESIEDHSRFMWQHRHLTAIPKTKVDETGQEIVEVGAHRRGIVEELEKAHIYIEQLHKQNKALEARLVKLEAIIVRLDVSQKGKIK